MFHLSKRLERGFILLFPLMGVLLAGLFYRYTGFLYDDAYITLRYARNMVEGNGLVFNPGEPVLGTTAPFFAFWLAFWHLLTHLSFPWLAVLSGGLGFGWCAYLTYRILKDYHQGMALLIAGLFLLHPQSVKMSATGMETGVYLALLLTTYYGMAKKESVWAGVTGALLFLTRPEGGLFFFLLCIVQGVRRKKVLPMLLVFSVLTSLWEIYAYTTYGSWLPVSIAGKGLYFQATGWRNVTVAMILDELFGNWWNKIRILLLFSGAWISARDKRNECVLFLFALVVGGYLYVKRYVVFPWYLSSAHLAFFIMVSPILEKGWAFSVKFFQRAFWRGLVAFIWMGFILILILQGTQKVGLEHKRAQANYEGSMILAARWMQEHSPPGATVMALEIGVVGYYTHLRILDWGGLVSPPLLPYIRTKALRNALQDFSPDLIFFYLPQGVTDLFRDPEEQKWFDSHYQIIRDYPNTWNPQIHYVLFQRRERIVRN